MLKRIFLLAIILGQIMVISFAGEDEDIIAKLEFIKNGYIESNRAFENIRVEGRIFRSQEAVNGRTTDSSRLFKPSWRNFSYVFRGRKKRFDFEYNPEHRRNIHCIIGDEGVVKFDEVGLLYIYPLSDSQKYWANFTYPLSCFFSLNHGLPGYENVGRAMETFKSMVQSGKLRGQSKYLRINVKDNLFTIDFRLGKYSSQIVIDSARGFHMVYLHHVKKFGKFEAEMTTKVKLREVKPGLFYPISGHKTGIEGGVKLDTRFEITKLSFGEFPCEERIFTLESLNMPVGTRVYDYRFTPALEYRYAQPPIEEGLLKRLLNTKISFDEKIYITEVDGVKDVQRHSTSNASRLSKSGFRDFPYNNYCDIFIYAIGGIVIIIGVSILVGYRQARNIRVLGLLIFINLWQCVFGSTGHEKYEPFLVVPKHKFYCSIRATCGVTCTYAILAKFGLTPDLDEVALGLKLSPAGVTMLDMRNYLQRKGLVALGVRINVTELLSHLENSDDNCAILYVGRHWIAALGVEKNHVLIFDYPKKYYLSRKDLDRNWKGLGILVSKDNTTSIGELDAYSRVLWIGVMIAIAVVMTMYGIYYRILWKYERG